MTALREHWALRSILLALVVLDLLFVHITGAVGLHWLLPLYALTAAAPLLRRHRHRLSYRLLWNASVLAVFALLVRHAGSGIQYLLEDGLLLAALCQVHLINNLGREQRADLLFFNSFLIALVTSFFSQSLVFALIFAAYAGALLLGLQLACAAEACAVPLAGLLRLGVTRAAVALAVTSVVFALWPRDFNREGLVAESLMRAARSRIGFTDRVELGRTGRAVLSNRVVFTAKLLQGGIADVPEFWRGATFAFYRSGRWLPLDDRAGWRSSDPLWNFDGDDGLRRSGDGAQAAELEVSIDPRDALHLFAPLEARGVRVRGGTDMAFVSASPDGTLAAVTAADTPGSPPLLYRLQLGARPTGFARGPSLTPNVALSPYTRTLPKSLGENGGALAERLAREAGDLPQHEAVERVRAYLASHFTYLLPGVAGAAHDLDDFLDGAGGHCEYFATALALLLRQQGIPCRLATGFLAHEWDAARGVLTVRDRDAHAWVEVRDPAGFWYAVDATPAGDAAAQGSADTLLGQLREWLGAAWTSVTGFDAKARGATLSAVSHFAQRVWPWLLLLIAVAAWRRGRRPARGPAAVVHYRRALARTRMDLRRGETPRELLERARGAALPIRRLRALEAATAAHESARYY